MPSHSAAAEPAPTRRTLGAVVMSGGTPERILPEHCPTIPLGFAGQYIYVLDPVGQLHRLDTERLGHKREINICSIEWLYQNYPRKKKGVDEQTGETKWITVGWRPEQFYEDLEAACKRLGYFDEALRVRGRGAYLGEDGGLILHLGNRLVVGGRVRSIGMVGDYVYSLGQALPGPAPAAVPAIDGPAARLMRQIAGSWNLGRRLDPVLIIGLIGAVILAGALPVRPGFAFTGERGTGKSELLDLMSAILGTWLVQSSDSTEAGMRQKLGRDAIGMILDEQESTADNSGLRRVLRYWRASYDGKKVLRGGQSHTGAEFIAHSVLAVAAINLPPMESQDRSRIAIIETRRLPEGEKVRLLTQAMWPQVGAELVRRAVDHFPRLGGSVLPAWRRLLMTVGWDDRGANTYGVILACAWLLLRDGDPTEADLAEYAADLAALQAAHKGEEVPTYRRVLMRLFGWRVDLYRRGEQRTLGEYVRAAGGWGRDDPAESGMDDPDPRAIDRAEPVAAKEAEHSLDAREACRLLKRFGLLIIRASHDHPQGKWTTGERLLAIANSCVPLAEIFRGTPWAGTESGQGGWNFALLRAPSALVHRSPLRFPWGSGRCVVMRLDVAMAGMVGSDPDVAEAWDRTPQDEMADA